MVRRLPLVGVFVLSFVPGAHADDQTIRGSLLIVKNPGALNKRYISVDAKESNSPNSVVGNPVTNGATVAITVNGATPSTEGYALPAGSNPTNQKPFWTGDAARGFRYSDAKGSNGPVKSALVKLKRGLFRIKIRVDGRLGPIAVVPPNPGSNACVLFNINGGDSYSVQFASGQVTNKGSTLFKVAKPVGEGSCVPTTTSSTTSTTTTSSTTTTTLGFHQIPPPGPAPLRYRDLVFGTATTTSNIVYGSAMNLSGQTVTLLLDLYEPTDDMVTERPTIVWVHGGGFSSGSKTSPELVDEATVFARKGYVNASISYRLEPGGCNAGGPTVECIMAIQEALQDAQRAVRFLRTNATTYGIDVTRIAMGGTSAGAITALNVGFNSAEAPLSAIGAAVSLSGARLLGAVGAGDAPSLLFHGDEDNVVPYPWAVDTVTAATAAGLDSFLTTWPDDGHVPYSEHRTEILDQTTNFLWWEMDLENAAQ